MHGSQFKNARERLASLGCESRASMRRKVPCFCFFVLMMSLCLRSLRSFVPRSRSASALSSSSASSSSSITTSRTRSNICKVGRRKKSRSLATMRVISSTSSGSLDEVLEFLLYSSSTSESMPYVNELMSYRPSLETRAMDEKEIAKVDGAIWTTYRGNIQLDCYVLESHWLGAKQCTKDETVQKRESTLAARLKHISSVVNSNASPRSKTSTITVGDGGT